MCFCVTCNKVTTGRMRNGQPMCTACRPAYVLGVSDTIQAIREQVKATADKVNATELTPTGDDYNTLLSTLGLILSGGH
jgi:hypothetical protein